MSKILPRSRHWDSAVREEANMVDYLSHRSGLAPKNEIWGLEMGQAALTRWDAVTVANSLEKVALLRATYGYNNWGYALADEVITALAEKDSRDAALRKEIIRATGDGADDHEAGFRAREPGRRRTLPWPMGRPITSPRPFPEDGQIMQGCCRGTELRARSAAVLHSIDEGGSRSGTASNHIYERKPPYRKPRCCFRHIYPCQPSHLIGRKTAMAWLGRARYCPRRPGPSV